MTTDYKKLAIDSIESSTYAQYQSEQAAYVQRAIAYALLALLELLEKEDSKKEDDKKAEALSLLHILEHIRTPD